MLFARHRDRRMQRLTIGQERAPLLVIDNLLSHPEDLVDFAAGKLFGDVASYYPGVRAKVPLTLQKFIIDDLRDEFVRTFGINGTALHFTGCHFSLVTTPPSKLTYLQRIPHVDSLNSNELAMILYLFKADFGGTSFYRHRSSGFEVIDQGRKPEYWRLIAEEQAIDESAPAGYIHGSNGLYEEVGHQEGRFNRMLVYRRTSLHSAKLDPAFGFSPDPRQGRLSVNGFLA
jgi:hypothetical protein